MLEKIHSIKNLLSTQLETLNDLYSKGLLEGSSEKFLSCASLGSPLTQRPCGGLAAPSRIESDMKETMLSARKMPCPQQNSVSSRQWPPLPSQQISKFPR